MCVVTSLTNDYEGDSDDESQNVASDWLVVLAVSLGEELQCSVDVVFTQSLRGGGREGEEVRRSRKRRVDEEVGEEEEREVEEGGVGVS
jgi:hypothetical protein